MLKRFLPLLLCAPLLASAQTAVAAVNAPPKTPAPKTAAPKTLAKPAANAAPKAASKVELPPRTSGSKDAPIVLEVFSDFQCPGCKQLYQQSIRPLIADYCDKGKVFLIHHDFLIPGHAYSREAARWANAAATVGKYEEAASTLFNKQDQWTANGNIEPIMAGILTLGEFAKVKEFHNTRTADIDAAIDSDIALGNQLKVTETPSVKVVNKGKIVAPLAPAKFQYSVLKRFLDDQLTK